MYLIKGAIKVPFINQYSTNTFSNIDNKKAA